ncbi:MAG: hypothetical protein ACRD2G_06895, partial [Terriglobia bacterium]
MRHPRSSCCAWSGMWSPNRHDAGIVASKSAGEIAAERRPIREACGEAVSGPHGKISMKATMPMARSY